MARFLANVLLFLPPALTLGVAGGSGSSSGIATSVGSELVHRALPGRDSSVKDVIANSLGAALG